MARILIFILAAVFFAFVATALLGVDGRVVAEAFGARYDIHTGFALLSLVVALALAVGLILAFRYLTRVPGKVRDFASEGARTKGLQALTRGLEAVAAGDGRSALKLAKQAERQLKDASLTRLLTAQAAQLTGDDAAARESFTAMLAAPETEFLGLRGLHLQAERAGDRETARTHAERAFQLRPDAQWAFQSVFDECLRRGAWGQGRDALATAEREGAVPSDKSRRGQAALLAADAYAAAASGEAKLALQEAERALKIAPGLAPAATLIARLNAASGKMNRGRKVLERSFAEAPQLALVDALDEISGGASASERAESLKRLAAAAPDAAPGKIALALSHAALGDHASVARILEPLLKERATARLCAMMAETAVAIGGAQGEAAARDWLKRAASAPREFTPGAGPERDLSREGWAMLIREFMEHGRMSPPTLDPAPAGVTEDEMKRLAPVRAALSTTNAPNAAEAPADAASLGAPPPASAPPAASEEGDVPLSDQKLVGDRVSAARAIAAAGQVS
jgi:HemY protein